ncbi:MAG: AzlC family ABC transporter permease [Corynebacterium sp.]|nr:AzlC family ABC transporter permease [Corynebacterium sp.]
MFASSTFPSQWSTEVAKGFRDTWAVALGLVPLGLAFGVLVVQTGFDWWWAPVFSLLIYAGSTEFLALAMITSGTSALAAAVTGFMVNFRHIFYGLTFPRHRISSPWWRGYSTYVLTDESYAIVSSLPREETPTGTRVLSIQVLCQLMWVGGGIVGALAGGFIPPDIEGFEFALIALFVVLTMDTFRNNPDYSLPVIAGVLAIAAAIAFPGQVLTIALTAYFVVLLVRFYFPGVDAKLT